MDISICPWHGSRLKFNMTDKIAADYDIASQCKLLLRHPSCNIATGPDGSNALVPRAVEACFCHCTALILARCSAGQPHQYSGARVQANNNLNFVCRQSSSPVDTVGRREKRIYWAAVYSLKCYGLRLFLSGSVVHWGVAPTAHCTSK